jgi:hypothetical protein
MSNTSVLAVPDDIEINGIPTKLWPISFYAIGRCQSTYAAMLRRVAIESTIGLPRSERDYALENGSHAIANLVNDPSPLLNWLRTPEGLPYGIRNSIEGDERFTIHQIASWIDHDLNKGGPESAVLQWMFKSGLCSDPTIHAHSSVNHSQRTDQPTDGSNLSEEHASTSSTV